MEQLVADAAEKQKARDDYKPINITDMANVLASISRK
jgi:hypothetical protein